MDAFWTFLARIRALILRNRFDRDLNDELQAHLELLVMEYRKSGLNPNEAVRAARLRLGGIDQTKEVVRDERRIPWIANFFRDAAEALRKWRRHPGMVVVTVLTLAVGVGANIAMYDLVNALMFRPPDGVSSPDRLVRVRDAGNYVKYSDIRDQSKTLEVATYNREDLEYGTAPDVSSICVECVTASYFPVLGTRPVIGRIFSTDEDAERRNPGALLSNGFWQREFGGDPNVLGQPVTIGGRIFSVAGIAPKGFRGVELETVDAWILVTVSPEICSFTGRSLLASGGTSSWLRTIGRLRDGVALSQAEAEVRAQASPEVQVERASSRNNGPILQPILESRRDHRAERLALWLAGGALVLLVIACANVTGLASIRAMERKQEIAVRLQLGADRLRILSQHAAEYLLQSLFSGVAAALTAGWIATTLQTYFSYESSISLFDWRLFAVAFGLTLLAGILSGMVPALQASRSDETSLASSCRSRHDRKVARKTLLILQVALALLLVIGAGLFTRSVQNTRRGLGIDLDRVVITTIKLDKTGVIDSREIQRIVERMADRIRHQSNIENVSISSGSLLGVDIGARFMSMVKYPDGMGIGFDINAVTPEYFSTLGTRICSGRAFTDEDNAASEPVTIINEIMAGTLWPGEPALGKCVTTFFDQECFRIVGVSESRRPLANFREASGEIFTPYAQAGTTVVPHTILIRTRGPAAQALPSIAAAVRSAASNLTPGNISIQLSEDLAGAQARSWRVGQTIFSLYGAVSLMLASLGLYAILAFSVRRRIPEIGIRMAVGASTWDILRHVLRQGFLMVAIGWLLGIGAAVLMTKYIEKLLFHVEGVDTGSFIIASLIVLGAAIAGCLIPSIRAAQVDPVLALRHE